LRIIWKGCNKTKRIIGNFKEGLFSKRRIFSTFLAIRGFFNPLVGWKIGTRLKGYSHKGVFFQLRGQSCFTNTRGRLFLLQSNLKGGAFWKIYQGGEKLASHIFFLEKGERNFPTIQGGGFNYTRGYSIGILSRMGNRIYL